MEVIAFMLFLSLKGIDTSLWDTALEIKRNSLNHGIPTNYL